MGDPRLRFNTVDNLYHLGRYTEAAELLPQVRELVKQQARELDSSGFSGYRQGLGRARKTEEATAALEQVQG